MSEAPFFMTVICFTCLVLSVHACGSKKFHLSKCQSYLKGYKQKPSYPESNQPNHSAVENVIVPTGILHPSSKAPVSSSTPLPDLNANNAPEIYHSVPMTMAKSMNVKKIPCRYHRSVRLMGRSQLDSKVKDDITPFLTHDLNLRDDVIQNRMRRNDDNITAFSTTHHSIDPNPTPSWQDLINFFQFGLSSDVVNDHDEDKESWRRSQETDNSEGIENGTLESDESSESSTELLTQFRELIPQFYQQLQSLRKLIADSSSIEEAHYDDTSRPFNTEKIADFDYDFDTTEMTQLKKPEAAGSKDLIWDVLSRNKLIPASLNHGDTENSTFATIPLQDHETTTTNS